MDPSLPPRELPPLQSKPVAAIKPSRKKLFLFLGALILLIALGLTWFLGFSKNTTLPNFLYPNQKSATGNTYSVINFDSKKVQNLRQGDILTGSGFTDGSIVVFFTPGDHKKFVYVDQKGNWSYQIPTDLKDGNYYLTLQINDQSKIVKIKSYPVSIKSNNVFGPTGLNLIPLAKAQTIQKGPEYAKWVTQMQLLGVYPAEENGEIVYYNRDQFIAKFCQGNSGCVLNSPSNAEILNGIKKDQTMVYDLETALLNDGYKPFESLIPYFPELADSEEYKQYLKVGGYLGVSTPPTKTQIDPTTLSTYIKQIATKAGFAEKDPIQILINATDPIFGTRALIKIITLPPSQVSDDDRLSALLGITMIYGLSEKVAINGIKITNNMALDIGKIIQDVKPLRQAIKDGNGVPAKIIEETAAKTWIEEVTPKLTNIKNIPADISPGQLNNVEQAATSLSKAFPNKQFELVSSKGSSAVTVVDVNDASRIYKVYIKPNIPSYDAKQEFIKRIRYAQEEAQKLALLSKEGLAPKLYDFITPQLTAEDQALLINPNYGLFRPGNEFTNAVTIPHSTGPTDEAILIMERINIDPNGFAKLAKIPGRIQQEEERVIAVLERLKLFPNDVEPVVDTGGRFLFIDLGGMSPIYPESVYADGSIREAVLRLFNLKLDGITPASVDIVIDQVKGQEIPGGTLSVSSTINETGGIVETGEYTTTWTILPNETPPLTLHLIPTVYADNFPGVGHVDDFTPLPGGANCGESCQVTLPPSLAPGRYQMEVLLTRTGSSDILAIDSTSITVLAQAGQPGGGNPNPGGGAGNGAGGLLGPGPAGVIQLQQLTQRIIGFTSALAFIVLTIMLVYAGIKFITSNGEPKNIQLAQQTATWAILGIAFLVGAWLVLKLIESFTGVGVTQFCIGFRPYCLI